MKWFSYAVIIIAGSSSLFARSKSVTLEECIRIAMQHHPDIKVSLEEQNRHIAKYKTAKSMNKIRVDGEIKTVEHLKAETDPNKVNIPGRDTDFGLFAGLTATYNLIDPQKSNMEDLARIAIDMSKMRAVKVREKIVYNVKDAYFGYALARESSVLYKEMMKKFRVKLEKAKKLFKNGQRPILDVSKAEVDLANAMLEYEKGRNMEKLMKAKLLASMGIQDENIEVSPERARKLPRLKYSLKELYRLSEYNYPDIGIAKLRKRLNKIDITVQRSARYPVVNVYGSAGFENKFQNEDFKEYDSFRNRFAEKNDWEPTVHAGIGASFPIFDRGGIEGRVEAAIAEFRKSEYEEKKILMNNRSLIRAYLQAMNELRKQMEISRLLIENAKKHLMLAQKSYENGIGSQLDMQDAEMSVVKARLGLLQARYEYLKILARLSNIVGLGEKHLCEK